MVADANDAALGEEFDTNLTIVEVAGGLPFVRARRWHQRFSTVLGHAVEIAIADQYAGRHLRVREPGPVPDRHEQPLPGRLPRGHRRHQPGDVRTG